MLDILLMIFAGALILLSLLQGGKTEGIQAISGGGLNLFQNSKERGPEKIIANVTMVVGVLFFVLILLVRVIG